MRWFDTASAVSLPAKEVELLRILIRVIPFLRQHVVRLEEQNRLLAAAATEREHRLQQREAELTDVLTERTRKFQDREAELTDVLTERTRKFQDREAELTEVLTERVRRFQETEAELARAIAALSQRVARLSEHNRWLAETAMDAGSRFEGWNEDFSDLKQRTQGPRYLPQRKRVLMVTPRRI